VILHQLTVYAGPVHSEKSTAALHHASRLERLGKRVALIRPIKSIRPDKDNPETGDRVGMLVTKRGEEWPSLDLDSAADILGAFTRSGADALWLDEPGLWLGDDDLVFPAVQSVRTISPVIVSTITASSEGEPFKKAPPALWAAADDPVVCRADCDFCGTIGVATRSIYVGDGPKRGQVKVGGVSDYAASCVACSVTQAIAT
jgi:thymidine kinase